MVALSSDPCWWGGGLLLVGVRGPGAASRTPPTSDHGPPSNRRLPIRLPQGEGLGGVVVVQVRGSRFVYPPKKNWAPATAGGYYVLVAYNEVCKVIKNSENSEHYSL